MGCIWSNEPSNRCSVCNCKQSRDSRFINNKCTSCNLAEQSRRSRKYQFDEYISTFERSSNTTYVCGVLPQPSPNTSYLGVLPQPRPNTSNVRGVLPKPRPNTSNVRGVLPKPRPNTSNVRGVLPKPRPNTISEEPQFGEYRCKPCGHSWKSLRSWSTKYQMCKRCKKPVYPHKLRVLLPSDYTSTAEDPIEHPRELCQMCKHLGYACKNYGKNVNQRRKIN